MPAVSFPLVKSFLNIGTSKQDDELLDTVDRDEAILARRIGPLSPMTVVDEAHTGPWPLILRHRPVIAVTSVISGGLPLSGFTLDVEAGIVYGATPYFSGTALVTYTAGRSLLPLDLEAAVLELTKHLWTSQRPAGAQAPPGSPSGDEGQPTGAFLLPYRVQSLIEPYLRPSALA